MFQRAAECKPMRGQQEQNDLNEMSRDDVVSIWQEELFLVWAMGGCSIGKLCMGNCEMELMIQARVPTSPSNRRVK